MTNNAENTGIYSHKLKEVTVNSEPFPYVVTEEAFDPVFSQELLTWLERDVPWSLHQEDFFEQYECNLLNIPIPPFCRSLFEERNLIALKELLETAFATKFTNRWKLVVHKLLSCQRIGIHTDRPFDDTETHRFIVQLNRGRKDQDGGHLLLFNSHNPYDIHRVFPPTHNTGIGIALSSKSFHAVTDVHEGTRYTLIYSFWQEAPEEIKQQDQTEIETSNWLGGARNWKQRGHFDEHDRELIQFLETRGVQHIAHTKEDLLAHLVGTFTILQRWKCPQYLCRAGLFHSIYGTETLASNSFSLQEREIVQKHIGREAERLVYLYSIRSSESLYTNLEHREPYTISDFRDGTTMTLDKQSFADLLALDLANALEQLPRINSTVRMIENASNMYEKAAPFLPALALIEMHWMYGEERRKKLHEMDIEKQIGILDAKARERVMQDIHVLLERELANEEKEIGKQ